MSESGPVPELTIVNDGPTPVLVLDGEELVGAKQNRIVNLTILVPPRTRLPLPVSCVEAGRWAHRSRVVRGRRADALRVGPGEEGGAGELLHGHDPASDTRTRAPSGTTSTRRRRGWRRRRRRTRRRRCTRRRGPQLDEFQRRSSALPRQVGAVFAINGAIVGLELFDSAATWRKSMRKIVESYGLDALDRRNEKRSRVSGVTRRGSWRR